MALKIIKHWAYSPTLVAEICERISLGGAITRILDGVNYPSYAEFCRWRRDYPEVDKMLQQAREDRTEWLRDELHNLVSNVDEDNVHSTKFKADVYKHLMGVENRRVFGQTKNEVNVTVPTQIIIDTGIRREEVLARGEDGDTIKLGQGEGNVLTENTQTAADSEELGESISDYGDAETGEILHDPSTTDQQS